jgi:membrane-associated protein
LGLLGLTAATETIFPPFPGDLLFLIVAGWAMLGGSPLAGVIAVGFLGCVAASCFLYRIGSTAGRGFTKGYLSRRFDPEKVQRAERLFSRHGPAILVASRFIPGIRSVLVVVAGASGMSAAATLFPVALSAAVWYSLLSVGGRLVGANADAARAFMDSYERWIWLAVGVAAGIYALIVILRSRRDSKG